MRFNPSRQSYGSSASVPSFGKPEAENGEFHVIGAYTLAVDLGIVKKKGEKR